MTAPLRSPRLIPAIEQIRQHADVAPLEARFGRDAVVAALRAEAASLRQRLAAAASGTAPDSALPATTADAALAIVRGAAARLRSTFVPSLGPVINATGVVIHTNLGRAPLAEAALCRIAEVGRGYVNLEYDLAAGRRGRRDVHAEGLLTRLTGAEAAVVVNNNAAAVLLLLAALARGREVVISRGELVEIGGGFRVPEVMAESGAMLREVGTTNRTRVADYEAALSERTALILRVHPSNFRIEGFTERPALADLAALARRAGVPLAEDLGSGCLGAPATPALSGEPTVHASVRAGTDIVCFSGDKLLGGPQAGIILGRRDLVAAMRRHPLMRALRVDKLTYAALEATLLEHAAGRAAGTVPVVRMLALTRDEIARRAQEVLARLEPRPGWQATLVDGVSAVGGGSAPGTTLPTVLVAVVGEGVPADALEARLRTLDPPVVARIEHDRVLFDLRTVQPWEDAILAEKIREAMAGRPESA
jgi:L-seryl-tRNA(Ser) seleniumtransferase